MKRLSVLVVVLGAFFLFTSASSWEGSAMMSAYGDFPPTGYYAACNSFPRNTAVEVNNLETGKTVTVIITGSVENAGIFMILSPESALAIGIQSGVVARIRASSPRNITELASPATPSSESTDPDFNPKLYARKPAVASSAETNPAPAVQPAVDTTSILPPDKPVVATPLANIVETPGTKPIPVPEIRPETPHTVPVTPVKEEKPEPVQMKEPTALSTLPAYQNLAEPSVVQKTPEKIVPPVVPEAPKTDVVRAKPVLPVPDEAPLKYMAKPTPVLYAMPEMRPDVYELEKQSAPPAPSSSTSLREPPLTSDRAALLALERPIPQRNGNAARLEEPNLPNQESPNIVDASRSRTVIASLDFPLHDPEMPNEESPNAFADNRPESRRIAYNAGLEDPRDPSDERPFLVESSRPDLERNTASYSLTEPEIQPDELPDIVIARLTEPLRTVNDYDLAEGEVIIEGEAVIYTFGEQPERASLSGLMELSDAEEKIPERPSLVNGEIPDRVVMSSNYSIDDAEIKLQESPAIVNGNKPERNGMPGNYTLEDAAVKEIEKPAVVNGEKPVPIAVAKVDPKLVVPDVPKPVEPVTTSIAPPSNGISLQPTKPLPPPTSPVTPVAGKPVPETLKPQPFSGKIAMITKLEKGKHYIQLGAFKTIVSLETAAAALGSGYTIAAESVTSKGTTIFRLFIGPLSRDESGVVLLKVKSLGYKDAFARAGE